MNIVAAASAQAQLGSRLLVFLIQEQEVNFGKPFIRQHVLRMVAEVRVGNKTWNFINSLLVPGVLTSPNYPGSYPENYGKTETIKIESGKLIKLVFTHFAVYGDPNACEIYDHVTITDGDGTTLMAKKCGDASQGPSSQGYFLPPIITTKSDMVDIFFKTNNLGIGPWPRSGWSLSWSAVTPGLEAAAK